MRYKKTICHCRKCDKEYIREVGEYNGNILFKSSGGFAGEWCPLCEDNLIVKGNPINKRENVANQKQNDVAEYKAYLKLKYGNSVPIKCNALQEDL